MIAYLDSRREDLVEKRGGPPPAGWPAARKELYREDLFKAAWLEWLPGHLGTYATGVLKNAWQFWWGAENRAKTLLFLALQAVPLAAAAAALAALVRLRLLGTVWCALLAIALLWSQYALVLAMGRYSLDLVPALGVIFGVGADAWLARREAPLPPDSSGHGPLTLHP
jgi:hypothetical protein